MKSKTIILMVLCAFIIVMLYLVVPLLQNAFEPTKYGSELTDMIDFGYVVR